MHEHMPFVTLQLVRIVLSTNFYPYLDHEHPDSSHTDMDQDMVDGITR